MHLCFHYSLGDIGNTLCIREYFHQFVYMFLHVIMYHKTILLVKKEYNSSKI